MLVRLKLWLYLIGILKVGSTDYESERTYIGRVQPIEATTFKKGHHVILPEGQGTIVGTEEHPTLQGIYVYIISLRSSEKKHTYLRVMEVDLLHLVRV